MNFEAKLAGFVYRDGTNGEGWPDCVTVDNGGILVSEYDTRAYYPIDRNALLDLVKELELGAQCVVGRKWSNMECERMAKYLADDYEMIACRIRKALGEDDG